VSARISDEELGALQDSTLAYYESHAVEYAARTLDADLSELYRPFLALVPAGGRILDLGCGAGRDLRAFAQRGFAPCGIDASPSLAGIAHRVSGAPTSVLRAEEISFDSEFDGVWACASLLHVRRRSIPDVLRRIHDALRAGGAFYASVQTGRGETRSADGRVFTLHEESEFGGELEASGFKVAKIWTTGDSLVEGRAISWLNFLGIRA
jgi:SAM-dependent methyltransferase